MATDMTVAPTGQ